MRAVDWSRIVLFLLGYLSSKAVTKTLPEDTATEGKSTLPHFSPLFPVKEEDEPAVLVANGAVSRSDADVT